MKGLVFKEGGQLELIRGVYNNRWYREEFVATDVTDRAAQFLMDPVRFEGALFLRDVFALLRANPLLLEIFARDFAADYLKVAEDRELEPYTGEYSPEGFEYLELYQSWEKDSLTGELTGLHRLEFHGVGFVLREDIMDGDWLVHEKGSRIPYALDYMPVQQLLNLPLRYNPDITIGQGLPGMGGAGGKVDKVRCSEPTLGQVIHGVLWELSFNGGPEATQAAAERLRAAKTAVDKAIASGDLSSFVEVDLDDPGSSR